MVEPIVGWSHHLEISKTISKLPINSIILYLLPINCLCLSLSLKHISINIPDNPTSSINLLEESPPIGTDIQVEVDIVTEFGGVTLLHNHGMKLLMTKTYRVSSISIERKIDSIKVLWLMDPVFDMLCGEPNNGQVPTPNCRTAY